MWQPIVQTFGLGPVALFDLGGIIGAAGMALVFLFSSVRNVRALYRLEPLATR